MATHFLERGRILILLILLNPSCLWALLAINPSTHGALHDRSISPQPPTIDREPLAIPEISKIAQSYGTQDFTVSFTSPSSALTKRAPYTFQALICKGEKYYQEGVLQAQAGNGPAGRAFTENDLRNGWEYKEARFPTVPDGWIPVMEAMRAGIPDRDEIYGVNLDSTDSFINGRGARVNSPHEGRYHLTYIPNNDIIIATDTISPVANVPKPSIPDRLPACFQLSDCAWVVWNKVSQTPNDLRFYAVDDVENDISRPVIDQILRNRRGTNWVDFEDKLTFSIDSEEGKALFGSPNGIAAAWIMIHRVGSLGRRVPRVTIWNRGAVSRCMLWDMVPQGQQPLFPLTEFDGEGNAIG
ncbi:MAG: hypothetical protein Q9174_006989 [Haloplaca sp. 1 TL-2023]